MVEEAIKSKVDVHYEPNNFVAFEIDHSRYMQKHIVEKYNFTEWKDENKSAFLSYKRSASRGSWPTDISSSPSPGDGPEPRLTILHKSTEKFKPPTS